MPENVTTNKTPTVKGKLKINLPFWENTLRANSKILTIIRDGYHVPCFSLPQASFKNNISAYQNKAFVDREVEQLLRDGCIVETQSSLPPSTQSPPHVVNPITVSKNDDGKCRLILDLGYINGHISPEYVRFDDWRTFEKFLTPNGWCFKFDLKHGYHQI